METLLNKSAAASRSHLGLAAFGLVARHPLLAANSKIFGQGEKAGVLCDGLGMCCSMADPLMQIKARRTD